MPIDYRKYPDEWFTDIRPRILARDGHCCKFCGVADRVRGWWVPGGGFYTLDDWAGSYIPPEDETAIERKMKRRPAGSLVVLTIAHLDHQLVDHGDHNLAALCQRCHLNHDRLASATKRLQNRRYSRRKKQLHLSFLALS